MKLNKSLITLIIGLLSYLYLLINIDKKTNFVFLYLLLLIFGYYFIKNNIFLYAPIIILLEIFKTKYYIEGNNLDKMVEEEEENDNSSNYDLIEIDEDDKKDMEDEKEQDKLINTTIGDSNI